MRNTQASKTIENVFKSTSKPVNLTTLFNKAKKTLPSIAYSTVFRIIQKFEQEQKIVKIDWRDRGSYYEWSELPHHHHLVCQNCNQIDDIADDVLSFNEHEVREKTGFKVHHHSIELYGLCQACQKGELLC